MRSRWWWCETCFIVMRSVVNKAAALLCDALAPTSRIGVVRYLTLQSESSGVIHQFGQHGSVDTRRDGKNAGIKITVCYLVIEVHHPGLARCGQPRYLAGGGKSQLGVALACE